MKKPCVKRNCLYQSFAATALPGKIPGQLVFVNPLQSRIGRSPAAVPKKRSRASDIGPISSLEIATNCNKQLKITTTTSCELKKVPSMPKVALMSNQDVRSKQMSISVSEPYKGPPLVLEKERELISDFVYLTFEQMRPTKLRQDDQVGCYRLQAVGTPGLACRHCYDVGQPSDGRYFPTSELSLSRSTTTKTIVSHMQRCRRCPVDIRERIQSMQLARLGPDGKKTCAKIGPNGTPGEEKPIHGGRKLFFSHLWDRIQSLAAEVDDTISRINFEMQAVNEDPAAAGSVAVISVDDPQGLATRGPRLTDPTSIKVRRLVKGAYKDPDDSKVQDKAIEHLRKFITSPEEVDKVIIAGGIELMARAMRRHPDKTIVQAEASCTVGDMAWVEPKVATKLSHSGILDLIVASMNRHRNHLKVQQMGCGAFRALSYDSDNFKVISEADGLGAVLNAMKFNSKKFLIQREGCCKSYSHVGLLLAHSSP